MINLAATMTVPKKKSHWMKVPVYPGGNEAFKEFITQNLQYPKDAEAAGIEGSVVVSYEVTDNGVVQNAMVTKGLGYGCDEEALRLIRLLRFEKVSNQGMRVKLTNKTTIRFNLNRVNLNYSITDGSTVEENPDSGSGNSGESANYTYTIEF